MRRLRELNRYRAKDWERRMGVEGDDLGGCFRVPSANGAILAVMVGVGDGWDHVSVSTQLRCPTWSEMEQVKRLFFADDETAMQLHVPPRAHINVHPYCLHLWRPHAAEIPLPPSWMVG